MDKTCIFKVDDINDKLILDSLKQIESILKEKGYNPINQIVGYLISGDPGYITSYKDARKLMMTLDRSKTLEVIVKNFLKWDI